MLAEEVGDWMWRDRKVVIVSTLFNDGGGDCMQLRQHYCD